LYSIIANATIGFSLISRIDTESKFQILNLATISVVIFGNIALVYQGVFLRGITTYWRNQTTWKYHVLWDKTYFTNVAQSLNL